MSFESYAAPFAYQHATRELLSCYPRSLDASELGALAELRAAEIHVPTDSYDARKWKLALAIESRAQNRTMVSESQKSRDAADARRLDSAKAAAARREAKRASREQRPRYTPKAEREPAPEDRLLAAVEAR